LIRTQNTSVAHSALKGKASTHPVNLSTNTNGSFDFDPLVIWVKSNCQSSPGRIPVSVPLAPGVFYYWDYFFGMFYIPLQLVRQCFLVYSLLKHFVDKTKVLSKSK
jgi:hypothetical protein